MANESPAKERIGMENDYRALIRSAHGHDLDPGGPVLIRCEARAGARAFDLRGVSPAPSVREPGHSLALERGSGLDSPRGLRHRTGGRERDEPSLEGRHSALSRRLQRDRDPVRLWQLTVRGQDGKARGEPLSDGYRGSGNT